MPASYSLANQTHRFLRGEGRLPEVTQWLIWVLSAVFVSWAVHRFAFKAALGIPMLLVALPVGFSLLWRTDIGLYLMLLLAFTISVFNRLVENVPMGVAMDAIIGVMLCGLFYRAQYHRNWSAFQTPISLAILFWIGMNVLEFLNPVAPSRTAWFYVVRPAVEYLMLYFIAYQTLDTPTKLFRFFYCLIAFSVISALWGIWQATFGYFAWEYNYVVRHDLVHLVFNYGRWRAIGSIGSPSQFGIIMAFICVCCLSLAFAATGFWKKVSLWIASGITGLAMVYSGTRSAFVIVPIFLLVWVVLSQNPKMYALLVAGAIVMTILIITPSNNYHIQRIQSTFQPSADASYQTRAKNRSMIFPWILKHPIGGGLGSTGIWGQRFSPGTFLANFAPDSGLIRVAVELGWIGLLFFLYLYYRVIVYGSRAVLKMKNTTYKAMVAGIIGGIVALLVVEWGQEVVGVFPMSILFWLLLAILFRAIHFDQTESAQP
jgi:putative inorganic carbon (HCO3(-)) transporter